MMIPGESFWFLLLGGALCVIGGLAGVAAERKRLGIILRDQAARNSELARRLTEQERLLSGVDTDNRALTSFLTLLPDVVRGLVARIPKREIPVRLAGALEKIFEPEQILIYQLTAKDQLVLAHSTGLPEGVDRNHTIRFGVGRIGIAAQRQTAADREDAHSESLFRRSQVESEDPPGLILDVIAPMVHGGTTLGVICVGKAARHLRDDRKIVRLVADLGALALVNQDLIARFENMANRDSLTGLSTKRFLNLRLGELINKAETDHSPLSVVIFDIDHFKKLNDTCGHLAGDEVLKMVATVIKSHVRSEDIPARYGGEEFVVLLPRTPKEVAVKVAEKIRAAIESQPLPASIGQRRAAGVTISGGVAALQLDGRSSQEILGAADQALYLAKEQGRNRIVEFRSRYLSDDEGEVGGVAL